MLGVRVQIPGQQKEGTLRPCFQDTHAPHETIPKRNYLGMKQQEDTSFFSSV